MAVNKEEQRLCKCNRSEEGEKNSEDMGSRLLCTAIEKNDLKMVQYLLNKGIDPNSIPLWEYILNSHRSIVKIMIRYGANVNCTDYSGWTPLHMVVEESKRDLLEILLGAGANVNTGSISGYSPLHVAVWRADLQIFDTLLNKGANIDARDNEGNTPLHEACAGNRPEIIKILLDEGVDINVKNIEGITPILMAAKCRREKCVKMLLDNDVDMNIDNPVLESILKLSKSLTINTIIKKHIIKVKYSRLDGSSDKESINLNSLNLNHFGRIQFPLRCSEELERMRSDKIYNNISYYDVLLNKIAVLNSVLENLNIIKNLNSTDHEIKFPIYGKLVNRRLHNLKRKELPHYGLVFFDCLSDELPILPYICRKNILTFLSYRDLQNLFEIVKDAV